MFYVHQIISLVDSYSCGLEVVGLNEAGVAIYCLIAVMWLCFDLLIYNLIGYGLPVNHNTVHVHVITFMLHVRTRNYMYVQC